MWSVIFTLLISYFLVLSQCQDKLGVLLGINQVANKETRLLCGIELILLDVGGDTSSAIHSKTKWEKDNYEYSDWNDFALDKKSGIAYVSISASNYTGKGFIYQALQTWSYKDNSTGKYITPVLLNEVIYTSDLDKILTGIYFSEKTGELFGISKDTTLYVTQDVLVLDPKEGKSKQLFTADNQFLKNPQTGWLEDQQTIVFNGPFTGIGVANTKVNDYFSFHVPYTGKSPWLDRVICFNDGDGHCFAHGETLEGHHYNYDIYNINIKSYDVKIDVLYNSSSAPDFFVDTMYPVMYNGERCLMYVVETTSNSPLYVVSMYDLSKVLMKKIVVEFPYNYPQKFGGYDDQVI